MSRPAWLPVVAVVLAAAGLIVIGCTSRTLESTPARSGTPTKDQTTTAVSGTMAAPSGGERLFQDWPQPVGALLISGEQQGYLEPCGCTAGQRGGLARRLDLVRRLRAQGWPLALIDLGSLANDPKTMGGPDESRIRFSIALRALELMDYDAVALSTDDLKLGVSETLMRIGNLLGPKPKFVSANVAADASLNLQDRLLPVVRTAAGPIQIGVTAVIVPENYDALLDEAKDALLSYRSPDDVLPEVLADLERDTHMQVLLVQGPPEAARNLVERHKGFEIAVATSPTVEPPQEAEPLDGGKTLLITVGRKGQYVGVLGLYQDPKQKFRYRRHELSSRYNNKTEPMRKLIDEDFQTELRQAGVLESYPRRPYIFTDGPTDATYLGAETCKSCHPNTYAKWLQTGHARAYEALTADPRRNREFDAQCVTCHTTGFEHDGGFVSAQTTPHLKGNQCENCHGPGSKHAADPLNLAFRQAIRRDATDFDKNHRCTKCHTEDDSPKFDFTIYWPKILHKGLDRYDDPKVKVGITPAPRASE